MSGFLDSLFSGDFSGAGSSLWESLPESSDIGSLLTGSTPSGKATGADQSKGFWEELISPKTVISGLGIYGEAQKQKQARELAEPLSLEEQAAATAQSTAQYLEKLRGELELKKEYGLLGGGGGGGDPWARAREIYLGKLRAAENQGQVGNNSAAITVEALRSMSGIGGRLK